MDKLKICWHLLGSQHILYMGDRGSVIEPLFLNLGKNSEDYGTSFHVETIGPDTYAVVFNYKHYECPIHNSVPIKYFKYILVQGHYEKCRDIARELNHLVTTKPQS